MRADTNAIRILAVDDHPIFPEPLAVLLSSWSPGLRVHGAGNLFPCREIFGRISGAKLDSYGPDLFGAFVPVE